MPIEVNVKPLPVQRVMSVRKILPGDASIPDRFGKVMGVLGPRLPHWQDMACVALYYSHPMQQGHWDIEIGMTVPPDFSAADVAVDDETITVHDLPPVEQAASYLYKGPYEGIGQQWNLFAQWLEDNGYQFAGPGREVYYNGPDDVPPDELLTEFQSPVVKVR